MFSPEHVLRAYFHAKDENRPLLLDRVFAEDALLEVHDASGAIRFPARTLGREAIADVLVRSFNRQYENIYSFYLERPRAEVDAFDCPWIVVMTEKDGRGVRVGCGRYEWTFAATAPPLACRLVIRIAAMEVLDAPTTQQVYAAIARLAYPWSSRGEVMAALQPLAGTAPALQALH